MKSFVKLTGNELRKIWGQTSFKVLIIIWAVIVFLSPIFTFLMSSLENMDSLYFEYDASMYENEIEAAYFGTEQKVQETLDEYTDNIWVYNTYFYILDDIETGIAFYSLILDEGYSFEEVNDVFYYYVLYDDEAVPDKTAMQAEYDLLKADLEEFKEVLKKGDIKLLVESRISDIEEEIDMQELVSTDKNTMEYDKAIAEFTIDVLEHSAAAYKKIIKEGNENNSWMLNTAEYMYEMQYEAYGNVAQSEQEYDAESDFTAQTYEDYLISVTKSKKLFDSKIAILEYSIEHKIPLSSVTYEVYTKDIWQSGLDSATSLIAIVILIAAATSVAGEYNTGTIRMLLIRPKKRWKILLSKYAAIITLGLAMVLTSYVVQLIISVVFSGVDGLSADIFITPSGSVYHLNSFASTLLMSMSGLVSAFFVATVAFFFGTIIAKTSLNIVLAYVVTIVSGIATGLIETLPLFGVSHKVTEALDTILSFTFIPYANYSNYYVSANALFGFDTFPTNFVNSLPKSALIITIVLIAWISLFVWIATLCFKKKDIKS